MNHKWCTIATNFTWMRWTSTSQSAMMLLSFPSSTPKSKQWRSVVHQEQETLRLGMLRVSSMKKMSSKAKKTLNTLLLQSFPHPHLGPALRVQHAPLEYILHSLYKVHDHGEDRGTSDEVLAQVGLRAAQEVQVMTLRKTSFQNYNLLSSLLPSRILSRLLRETTIPVSQDFYHTQ